MTVHALAEQIKGMYLTCVLASENTKPYFLMRRSSDPTFFFNLSSFSQTPLPEWEWKVRANQGVIAHHASQCYSECCPWFRVPDPKKTQSSMQSTGTDFNARLPFLLQVMQLWGEFSRGPVKKLTAPPSALLCRSQMMTFLAVTVLRVLIVSVCPHLVIYPWVSEAVFHVFLPLHHFLDGSLLGASAYFTAAILLPSSFIIQMHLKVSCSFISPQGMRPSPHTSNGMGLEEAEFDQR